MQHSLFAMRQCMTSLVLVRIPAKAGTQLNKGVGYRLSPVWRINQRFLNQFFCLFELSVFR
jgi:hypothetical protein